MKTKKEYNKPDLKVIKVKLQNLTAGSGTDQGSSTSRSLRNSWDEKPTWDNE